MKSPFFSIIIPTRNRHLLLKDAVLSALLQDFDDFEVVVSDNFNDEKTQEVLNQFQNNPRLTIYRTNKILPMPEHWEFASLKARGKYVLILTDRSVLKQHALRTIYDAISATAYPVEVCSWRWSLYDDVSRHEYADVAFHIPNEIVTVPSDTLAKEFCVGSSSTHIPHRIPVPHSGCYHADLAANIRAKFGALFRPLGPDTTAGFLFMACANKVLFLDKAIFIAQGLALSNGGKMYSGVNTGYLNSLSVKDYCAHVPIKVPLVNNLLYEDYLAMQELASGKLSGQHPDWVRYFFICYKEILEKKAFSFSSKTEIKSFYDEWVRALTTFDKVTQWRIRLAISILWVTRIKLAVKGSRIGPWLVNVRRKSIYSKNNTVKSVLEAAGFDA